MPTSTEIFINAELPKRPYTNQFPFTAGHVPVATGVGLQVEARALTTSDISGMNSYATQEDLSNVLVGLWDDRGAYTVNAAGNINYPSSAGSGVAGALMKGDIFTVAGAVAGVSTINNIAVNNGDTVRALVDNPSATDNAHWAIAENNIGYVPENTANKTTNTDLSGAAGTYPDTPTVKSYIDKYDISAASINSTGTVTLTRTASDLTFQVPTAISGLSFDANTGVLTSSYTNNATSTTITVAANEVSDNVFRIKDNTDATKKIAFEASGIATGQTRTITMPNLDIDLGKIGLLTSSRITPTDSGSITLQSNKLYHVYQPSGGITSYTFILPSAATSGDIIEIHDSGNNFAATTTLIFRANKTFLFPQGISASVSGSAPNIEWTDTRRATNKRWKFTYYSDYGGFWLVEELGVGGAGSPELSAMRKANSSVGVVHNIDAVYGTNKTITYPNRDVDLGLVGNSDFADTAFRISDNTDSTKKIAFEAAYIGSGTTKTIIMPNSDIDLSQMPIIVNITSNTTYSVSVANGARDHIILTTSDFTLNAQQLTTSGSVIVRSKDGVAHTVTRSGSQAWNFVGLSTDPITVSAGNDFYLGGNAGSGNHTCYMTGSFAAPSFAIRKDHASNSPFFTFTAPNLTGTKTITMPNRDIDLNGIPFVNDGAGSLGITNNQVNYLLLQQGVFAFSLPITYASTGTSTIFVLKSNSVSSAPIFVNFTWSGQSAGFTLSPQVGYSDQSTTTAFLEYGPFTPLVISGASGNKVFQIGTLNAGGAAIISVSQNGSGNFGLKVAYIDGGKLGANNSNLKIYKNLSNEGIATTIDASNLTTANTLTLANKNVNLGDLPSVATTDNNNLTGAQSRIVSGSNNTLPSAYSTIASSDYCSTASTNSNSSIIGCQRSTISGTGTYNKLMYCLGGSFVKGADINGSGSRNIVVGALAALDTASAVYIDGTAAENFVYGARAKYTQAVTLRGSTSGCTLVGTGGGVDLNNCSDSALIAIGGNIVSSVTWTSANGVVQVGGALPVQSPANTSSYFGVGTTGGYYSAQFVLYNTTEGTNIVLTTDGFATVSANNSPNIESNRANSYDIDIYLTSGTNRVALCRRRVFANPNFGSGNFIQVDTVGTDTTWNGNIPTVTITIDTGTGRLKVACSATNSALAPLSISGRAFVTMKSF